MSPAHPTPESPSLYTVLGLRPTASAREIRDAYHRLARLLHPDAVVSRPEGERALSERRMREVNAAYAVLGDETGRRDYDRTQAQSRASDNALGATARSNGPASGATRSDSTSRVQFDASRFRFDAEPDVDDEGRRIARAGDHFDDEPDLSPMVYFLLRKGPVIAAILVAMFLFILTAYATGNRTPTKAPIPDPRAACVETPAEPCPTTS